MAHNLEITENGAAMAYAGENGKPWHQLGHDAGGLMTAAEAIKLAQLDWLVEMVPVYTMIDGKYREVPKRLSVSRETDGRSFGIVSPGYNPVQNIEAFEFFDTLVDDGEAKYDTAGALADGRRIWMTAKIGETIQIAGQDAYEFYALLVNDHSGTKALTLAITPIRVVCENTETMALKAAKSTWTLNHRKTLDQRIVEARESLELTFKYQEAFEAEVEKMLGIEVTVDRFKKVLEDVLPDQKTATPKKVEKILDIYQTSPTIKDAGIYGNAYGAYNAVTEFVSHKAGRSTGQSPEAKMTFNLWGGGRTLRNDTHDALLELV